MPDAKAARPQQKGRGEGLDLPVKGKLRVLRAITFPCWCLMEGARGSFRIGAELNRASALPPADVSRGSVAALTSSGCGKKDVGCRSAPEAQGRRIRNGRSRESGILVAVAMQLT